jgi:thiol-disulfide isomerase/thioredoxin
MGKASRTKVDATRREKIAAQRAAERRAEQRRRILIASGSIIAVIAVVVAFIVIKANNKPATNSSNGPTGSALASVVSKVTNVPASTLDKIGSGSFTGKIPPVNGGTPLTSGGKPEMLYMGAEYCPYCAAERWSMIVALSRFGTFSGLSTVHSSTTDTPSNLPTFTFHGSSYTSKYLTFTPVEMQTNVLDQSTGNYPVLEKPTAAQQALLTKYDAAPYTTSAGAIPFIYFGGKYLSVGATYDPTVLNGKSWDQIASALSDPNSAIAKAIGGSANHITAAICKMTGNQPASACTATVQSLEKSL